MREFGNIFHMNENKIKRIKKKIIKLEEEIKILRKELHNEFVKDAIKTVKTWRPDLQLMLGAPPKRVENENL